MNYALSSALFVDVAAQIFYSCQKREAIFAKVCMQSEGDNLERTSR
jgi:hypothetical protein